LFTFYSLLLHNSQHQQQLQRDILRTSNSISLAEFCSFTDTFEITPQVVSRHVVSKMLIPQSHVNFRPHLSSFNEDIELDGVDDSTAPTSLTYPEFLETLGRIAIYSYSKYPFCDMLKTSVEKLENLFDNMGFNDSKKYQFFMKNAGLHVNHIQVHHHQQQQQQQQRHHQPVVRSDALQSYAQMSNISSKNTSERARTVVPKRQPPLPSQKQQEKTGFIIGANSSTTSNNTSKRSLSRPSPTPSASKYEALLSNKVKMKDELQRIFMYYCSFGNRMNMDLMSSSKFKMFARDVKLQRHSIKQQETDLVFVSVVSGAPVLDHRAAKQKLTFTNFIAALKALSVRIYDKVSPSHALVQFFVKDVFPYAKRLSDKNEQVDMTDEQLLSVLEVHRRNLQKLFYFYCNTDDMGQSRRYHISEAASCSEFLRLISDFDLIPSFVSKKDVYRIFRSAILESGDTESSKAIANSNEEIVYTQFEECICKVAMIAYSKHPYDKKYQNVAERTAALFHKIGIKDWRLTLKKLEKIGRRVSGFSATMDYITNNILNKTERTTLQHSPHYGGDDLNSSTLSHVTDDDLPPEHELEEKLRDIFLYYVQVGDHSANNQVMRANQFTRFVRDTRMVDTVALSNDTPFGSVLTQIEAELVFIEMTKSGSMTFDVFCDSLAVLASKKFCRSTDPNQEMSPPQALRHLFLYHILPYARIRRNIHDVHVSDDALGEFLKYDMQLHKICKYSFHYSNRI
jgi:hypothetical protein